MLARGDNLWWFYWNDKQSNAQYKWQARGGFTLYKLITNYTDIVSGELKSLAAHPLKDT